MRAAGVPTRVVTGYQGGEVNPLNNELIVRQADAHAWTEIWVADEGWVRVDPTAAVSPLRVESGVNAALGPIGVYSALIAADPLRILANLRNAWQAMNSQWDQWVVGYNVDRQRQFFSRLGFPSIDWRTLGLWLMAATFLVGGAVTIGLLVRDRPPRREASLIAWNRFCAKLAAAGVARAPHEGPIDYLSRV
jgi:transglutaminase-like putative cysteine protease